jgi:hypothetical protein
MLTERNLKKIKELRGPLQWVAKRFIEELQKNGWDCIILEAYRSQEKQNIYFCKGRDEDDITKLFRYGYLTQSQTSELLEIMSRDKTLRYENAVTWTLNSLHTQRLALDIKPLRCSFDDLKGTASIFCIEQPLPQDRWHHEFTNATLRPRILSTQALKLRLLRGIRRVKKRFTGKRLQRMLTRLESKLNEVS